MVSSQRGVGRRQRHQLSANRRDQNRQVRHCPPGRPQHLRLHAVHLPNRLHSGESRDTILIIQRGSVFWSFMSHTQISEAWRLEAAMLSTPGAQTACKSAGCIRFCSVMWPAFQKSGNGCLVRIARCISFVTSQDKNTATEHKRKLFT